jgi:hypothetical protein
MTISSPTKSLAHDAKTSVAENVKREMRSETGFVARVSGLCAAEHPAVMGGRIGACLFSSFAFPFVLWGLGAVDATTAALISAATTLMGTRPVLLMGGLRIAPLLALQIIVALLVFTVTFPLAPALMLAAFLPLLGMLGFVVAGASIATARFARDDRLQEADVVIARATHGNVVDIRAAGISRRGGTKSQPRSGPDALTRSRQDAG